MEIGPVGTSNAPGNDRRPRDESGALARRRLRFRLQVLRLSHVGLATPHVTSTGLRGLRDTPGAQEQENVPVGVDTRDMALDIRKRRGVGHLVVLGRKVPEQGFGPHVPRVLIGVTRTEDIGDDNAVET